MEDESIQKIPPIGEYDFKNIRTNEEYFYVDKTSFISEFINRRCNVLLITRPRRFGKTLNLSTLKYFFDIEEKAENLKLFEGLKVTQDKRAMAHFGSRPVIFLSFKECKVDSFEQLMINISNIFQELVIPFTDKKTMNIHESDRRFLQQVRDGELKFEKIYNFLKTLSRILGDHYNKKPLILLDEYDVPIQAAYTYKFYEQAALFFHNLFSATFKDNPYIDRALITGCLRISKESIFTGLNNPEVATILDNDYKEHFGFTEEEVKKLLIEYNLEDKEADVKLWYNGYVFHDLVIYNPWSILNFIKQKGNLAVYWINTSDNALVRDLIYTFNSDNREKLEILLNGKTIEVALDVFITFSELKKSATNIWNLFYFTGYLTLGSLNENYSFSLAKLKIPNLEIYRIFHHSIRFWFSEHNSIEELLSIRTSLKDANIIDFKDQFTTLVKNSFSYFDVDGKNPEKFYHGFLLGLLATATDIWQITSNKEAGLGRFDILLSPKDLNDYGIILELKTFQKDLEKNLAETATRALEQIIKKDYARELKSRGANKILEIGIGFKGKELELVSKLVT